MDKQPYNRDRRARDEEDQIICPLDGIRIQDHDRCARCHILTGPEHYEKALYQLNDRIVCADCVQVLRKTS